MSVVLFLFCAWLAYHAVQDARTHAWTGPKTPAMRGRAAKGKTAFRSPGNAAAKAAKSAGSVIAHPGNRQIRAQAKADVRRVWQETAATNWLEQQRHDRQNGTGGTAVAAPPKPTLKQRLRLVPYTPPPQDPGSGGSNAQSANGGGVNNRTGYPYPHDREPPEERAQRERAARYQAQQNGTKQARPAANGGTPVAGASTAAAQKMIEGINEIQAHAQSGGIHAKREALAAIHEGATRFAAMVQMLSRQMAEPGMNYGPEITEPLAKAGQHFNAGAMTVSEADNAIEALINMTVGDLAKSPRQAPHHRELTENGSR